MTPSNPFHAFLGLPEYVRAIVVLCVRGCLGYAVALTIVANDYRIRTYPLVEATVTGFTYDRISIRYVVDGREYIVREFAADRGYEAGEIIQVHINPLHPDKAYMVRDSLVSSAALQIFAYSSLFFLLAWFAWYGSR